MLTLSVCGADAEEYDEGTELHVIGVYEGSRHFGGPVEDPSASTIDVQVHVTEHPVVLALSNYEPVLWNIIPDDGVEIKEIILSSYNGAKFSGIDESRVRITRHMLSIGYRDDQLRAAASGLRALTGLDVKSYQGMYKGRGFSVGP